MLSRSLRFPAIVAALAVFAVPIVSNPNAVGPYPWRKPVSPGETIGERISPPRGFARVDTAPGSFASWLRGLPLKPGRPIVHLYNGQPKKNQEAHFAVIDMDVGSRDLQQCADAVIRLRSEFLFSRNLARTIRWSYTSGDMIAFSVWASGRRPVVDGRRVVWTVDRKNDSGYESFRRYLENIYTYSGSQSLARDLRPVRFADIQIGDVFLQAGSPGHAVIVLEMASHKSEKAVLLGQSYMPAQEMHVLRNPSSDGPWYMLDAVGPELETPEWTFARESVRRFQE